MSRSESIALSEIFMQVNFFTMKVVLPIDMGQIFRICKYFYAQYILQ